jgi:copper chaperone NosL
MRRRQLLAHGLLLTPLAAALLAACGDKEVFAEGMLPIKWDRDTCTQCSMAISDRRFAVQLRGGPGDQAYKFDDIGCAATWCADKHAQHPWASTAATRWWVAEFGSTPLRWLDARRAFYIGGKTSPMGYNFGAVAQPQAGSLAFEDMAEKTAAAWPANCRPGSNNSHLSGAAARAS